MHLARHRQHHAAGLLLPMRVGFGIVEVISPLMRAVVEHHHADFGRADSRLGRGAFDERFRLKLRHELLSFRHPSAANLARHPANLFGGQRHLGQFTKGRGAKPITRQVRSGPHDLFQHPRRDRITNRSFQCAGHREKTHSASSAITNRFAVFNLASFPLQDQRLAFRFGRGLLRAVRTRMQRNRRRLIRPIRQNALSQLFRHFVADLGRQVFNLDKRPQLSQAIFFLNRQPPSKHQNFLPEPIIHDPILLKPPTPGNPNDFPTATIVHISGQPQSEECTRLASISKIDLAPL